MHTQMTENAEQHFDNLLFLSGWERFTPQVWWAWTFYASWFRCTTSAGQWCAATFLMSEFSRRHGPTTSTWGCCCLCCFSACCLLSTLSWHCLLPSTVGRSGQLKKGRAGLYMIVKCQSVSAHLFVISKSKVSVFWNINEKKLINSKRPGLFLVFQDCGI